jgi:hypothetical protein
MIDGRRADSARRRQRVAAAIDSARQAQRDLSVAAIARATSVDRSFLYRHHDLLAQIHTAQTSRRTTNPDSSSQVSAASLTAELANAHRQIARQAVHSRQLERRLSELLGDHAWHQASVPRPTSTNYNAGSPTSSNASSTCKNNSTNAIKSLPPRGQRTES